MNSRIQGIQGARPRGELHFCRACALSLQDTRRASQRGDELRLDFSVLEQEPPVVRARHEVVVRVRVLLYPSWPCHGTAPFPLPTRTIRRDGAYYATENGKIP